MELLYQKISKQTYEIFHRIMTEYYYEGEDEGTPQEILDEFIQMLLGKIEDEVIEGRLVTCSNSIVGFVLWMKDEDEKLFSEKPGYGTILEIGVVKEYRNAGIGKVLVSYAEEQMRAMQVQALYVCAYGPAELFWKKRGYFKTGEIASNGLPILMKKIPSRITVTSSRLTITSKTIEEMEQKYQIEENEEMKQAYFEMVTEMKRIQGHEEWACDWTICLKSGIAIGGIGFKGIADEAGNVEVGYGIDEEYQNQGYATEAVGAMVQWALSHDEVLCVQAQTEAENEISQKVLRKNGFVRNGIGQEGPLFEVRKR